METLIIKLSQEEIEQLDNLIQYSPYSTIEEYIYESLNDLHLQTNFQEANNLLNIENKGENNGWNN